MSRPGFRIPGVIAALSIIGCVSPGGHEAQGPESKPSPVEAWPFVLPTPQEVRYSERIDLPGWRWSPKKFSAILVDEITTVCGPSVPTGLPLTLTLSPRTIQREQEYRLQIDRKGATIKARTEAGLFYGLQSLRALLIAVDGRRMVRMADIHDWPEFETRGLITGGTWSKQLGPLKFNLLQYPGGRGTLDAARRDAYLALVADCRRQYARFLSHEGYKGWFWDEKEPLDFSPEGYRKLEDYYRTRQAMGAQEFTVAFDDMTVPAGEGAELAAKHAEACLVVTRALREIDPTCGIIFCPVPYAGTSRTELFSAALKDGIDYLETVGHTVPSDIRIFWTGNGVFSPEVTVAQANDFARMIRRKPFFWDNDCITWLNELRPLSGRPADLAEHTSGYVGNICDRQETLAAASLPIILTFADYVWNPSAYDSEVSLQRAIRYVAGEQAEAVMEAWRAAQAAMAKEGKPVPQAKVPGWKKALEKAPNQEFARTFALLLDQLAKPRETKQPCDTPAR